LCTAQIFQFHYGSVKSNKDEPAPAVEEDFNSTMVRLKDAEKSVMGIDQKNFNSTMVRLKVVFLTNSTFCEVNFNSTMVRLKG